ncbi:MAG: DUF58 domain-containing protein [Oscillospiraceae bacterium]|nr:DUF58 domain-containing protein [Oscillospiraceae bacterium]
MILVLLLCIGAAILSTQLLTRKFGFRDLTYSLAFSTDEATEGDTVTLTETICSRKLLPLPWVKAELTTHAALRFASGQSTVADDSRFVSSYFSLLPYRKIERHWRVVCTQRGQFSVSHAVIVISDLFGTMELSELFPDAEATLTVLPAVRKLTDVSEPPQQLTGDIFRRRTLIPDRFAVSGIREYQNGDAVRDISWAASARSDTPMVWQYHETAFPAVTVLLNLETRDTDRDKISNPPAFENCVRLCASVLGEADRLRIPVRLCANARIGAAPAETRLSAGGLHKMLRMLAEIPDTIACRFSETAQRACESDRQSTVIVITAMPTADILHFAESEPRATILTLRAMPHHLQYPNIHLIKTAQHKSGGADM